MSVDNKVDKKVDNDDGPPPPPPPSDYSAADQPATDGGLPPPDNAPPPGAGTASSGGADAEQTGQQREQPGQPQGSWSPLGPGEASGQSYDSLAAPGDSKSGQSQGSWSPLGPGEASGQSYDSLAAPDDAKSGQQADSLRAPGETAAGRQADPVRAPGETAAGRQADPVRAPGETAAGQPEQRDRAREGAVADLGGTSAHSQTTSGPAASRESESTTKKPEPQKVYADGHEIVVTHDQTLPLWVGNLPGDVPGAPIGDPYGTAEVGEYIPAGESKKTRLERVQQAAVRTFDDTADVAEHYANATGEVLKPTSTEARVPSDPVAHSGYGTSTGDYIAGTLAFAIVGTAAVQKAADAWPGVKARFGKLRDRIAESRRVRKES
jgi:hypothetical protein